MPVQPKLEVKRLPAIPDPQVHVYVTIRKMESGGFQIEDMDRSIALRNLGIGALEVAELNSGAAIKNAKAFLEDLIGEPISLHVYPTV